MKNYKEYLAKVNKALIEYNNAIVEGNKRIANLLNK
jgi:hypothetical protein